MAIRSNRSRAWRRAEYRLLVLVEKERWSGADYAEATKLRRKVFNRKYNDRSAQAPQMAEVIQEGSNRMSASLPRFLIVDDLDARRDFLLERLRDRFPDGFSLDHRTDRRSGMEAIREENFEEVWLDHDLTPQHYRRDYSDGGTGLDLVRDIVSDGVQYRTSPPLFVVHTHNVERGEEMLRLLRSAGLQTRREFLTAAPNCEVGELFPAVLDAPDPSTSL